MAEHVISPELFELLDDYVGLLDAGEALVDDVVPATSPVIVFTESAFAQFFENAVGIQIEGFDDLYHSWLYGEALKHARALERLSAEYFSAIEIGEDDEDQMLDFEENAAIHRYGLYRNFKRFQLPEIRSARPELVFRYFYPGLLLGALLAALLIEIFS